MVDPAINTLMNKCKMLYLCSTTNAVLKPPYSLSMSLLVKWWRGTSI